MAIVGGIAAAGELGLGIYGATQGPPAGNVQLPPSLPGIGEAASGSQSALQGLGQYNTFGQNLGQATGVSQGLFNNPYAGGVQNAANAASPLAMQGGLNTFGAGGNLFGGSTALMNQAFDPQAALYARTVQQLQDQTRTGLEARGIDSTPYGAGVEGNVMSNFTIDWQNAQLQRMLQGLGGAEQGYGAASQLQQAGPQQYLAGASMPYGAFQGIGQGQLGALQGLGQFGQSAAQIPEFQQQQQQAYALGGQGAALQGGQLGLNQAQLGFNQSQQMGQGIGYGLGNLSNIGWGMGGGYGGGVGGQANMYNQNMGNTFAGWDSYFG